MFLMAALPPVAGAGAAPASTGGIDAAPRAVGSVTKYIYLARHGEGHHNVAAAAAQAAAHAVALEADPAAPVPPLRDPDGEAYRNARLTAAGRAQVAAANAELRELLRRTHYPAPEVVFSSPLHRASPGVCPRRARTSPPPFS